MTEHQNDQRTEEPPVGQSARSGEGVPGDGVGSRAHVRQTLLQARGTIGASRERLARGRTTAARAADRLGSSGQALEASLVLQGTLEASVGAYVRYLRADGVPPERMLVLVKSAVHDARLPELSAGEARELMADVVRWSIDAYYAAA